MAKDTNKDAVAVSEKTVTEPATKPATPKDAGAAPKKNEVKQKVEKADTRLRNLPWKVQRALMVLLW